MYKYKEDKSVLVGNVSISTSIVEVKDLSLSFLLRTLNPLLSSLVSTKNSSLRIGLLLRLYKAVYKVVHKAVREAVYEAVYATGVLSTFTLYSVPLGLRSRAMLLKPGLIKMNRSIPCYSNGSSLNILIKLF